MKCKFVFVALLAAAFTSCKKEESTSLATKADKASYQKESTALFNRIKNKLSPSTVNGSYYQVNSESTASALNIVQNEMVLFIGENEGQQGVNTFNDTQVKLAAELNATPGLKTVELPETITEQSTDQLINEVFSQLDTQIKFMQLGDTGTTLSMSNQLIDAVTSDAKETMREQLLNLQDSEAAGESTGTKQIVDASGLAFNADKSFRSSIANFKNDVDDNNTLSNDQKNALYGKANYLLSSLDLTIGLAMMNVNDQGGDKVVQGFFSWIKKAVQFVAKVVVAVVVGVAILVSASGFVSSPVALYGYLGAVGYGGYLYCTDRIFPWIDSWW